MLQTANGYDMWYTGLDIDFSPLLALSGAENTTFADVETTIAAMSKFQTGRATCHGTTWIKTPVPVLPSQGDNPIEMYGALAPCVITDNGGRYHMWYTAGKGHIGPWLDLISGNTDFNDAARAGADFSIRYATSTNGNTWMEHGEVMRAEAEGQCDSQGVLFPTVLQDKGEFKMWYTGIASGNPYSLFQNLLNGWNLFDVVKVSGTQSAICLATSAFPLTTTTVPATTSVMSSTSSLLSGISDTRGIVTSEGIFPETVFIHDEEGKGITIEIPKGTIGLNSNLEPLEDITMVPVISPPAPPAGNVIVFAYELGPDGAQFNPAITISMPIPEDAGPDNVTIAWWNGSEWVQLETMVDAATGKATAKISHFTIFALLTAVEPAGITGLPASMNTPPAPKDPAATTETNAGFNWTLSGVILGAVIVIAIPVMLIVRRKTGAERINPTD